MSKYGKKHRKALEDKMAIKKTFTTAKEALDVVVSLAHAKFDESVDAGIILGIDPNKGEQSVRGSVLYPHGVGKTARVLAFVKGEHYQMAQQAGADYVGLEDLISRIEAGWMDFDVAVATPDLMGIVGKVARILGPRGLLPNKKVGTVTFDIKEIISDIKKGRVSFKNDKQGAVHARFGRVSFGAEKLLENLSAFVKALQAQKPQTSKGKFIRKLVVSSTMGVGVELPLNLLDL